MALEQEVVERPLERLRPDPTNPRLPADVWNQPDERLYEFIERNYDAVVLAQSMSLFGYFPNEPLVVIEDGDNFRVIEGNRRLAALKGLLDPGVRAVYRNPARWEKLAVAAAGRLDPARIPTLKADNWGDAAPLIGYRHVSGIQKWDAYPKARFVTRLLRDGQPSDVVGSLVGESPGAVLALYRNYAILEQAREWGIPTGAAETAEELFGIFTAALNRRLLREFVGAPQPAQVQPDAPPLNRATSEEPLRELLSWLYGDENDESVIDESRDLQALARVVKSEDGIEELRRSRNLELADAAAGGPPLKLKAQLVRAAAALAAAEHQIAVGEREPDVADILDSCTAAIARIRAALLQVEAGGD